MTEVAEINPASVEETASSSSAPSLPDGIVRIDERVTATAPTPGLVQPFGVDTRGYVPVLWLWKAQMAHFFSLECELPSIIKTTPGNPYTTAQEAHALAVPEKNSKDPWTYLSLETEQWRRGPWAQHLWVREHARRWIEHLPKPSDKVPGLLSYFQSPEKRARDIRTPIKPGKYLKKFFSDVLSEDQIHELALEWANAYAIRDLKITQDADEIEQVYRGKYNGSCMHFANGGWSGSEHPARVYAGPDLAIAYIGNPECADARCLVWPEKKIYFAKWYGDGPRLEASLIHNGYQSAYSDVFHGARIRRIEDEDEPDHFVLPYLDVADTVEDAGDFLIVGRGEIEARQTNGLSGRVARCDECSTTGQSLTQVRGDVWVCQDCLHTNYFYCDGIDEYVPNEERAPTPDEFDYSQTYVDRLTRRGTWFLCDVTERYYPYHAYETVELVNGDTCVLSYAEEHGYFCAYSERWSLDLESKLELADGRTIDTDMFSAGELQAWLSSEGFDEDGNSVADDDDETALDVAA